jgi:hypothetical protein
MYDRSDRDESDGGGRTRSPVQLQHVALAVSVCSPSYSTIASVSDAMGDRGEDEELTDETLSRRLHQLRAEQHAMESSINAPSEKSLLDRFEKLAGVPAASTWGSSSPTPSSHHSTYDTEPKSEEDEVMELLEQIALEIKSDAAALPNHSQPIHHMDSLLLASHYVDPGSTRSLSVVPLVHFPHSFFDFYKNLPMYSPKTKRRISSLDSPV